MPLPDWRDAKLGTMVRSALWLVETVGEGGTFTKEQLRETFPGVSQVDRRVRDLRKYGWIILANTEDARLMPEEQRFVKQGVAVWDRPARRAADAAMALPAPERQEVLKRDGYMCTVCGIAGGEQYSDDSNKTAVLSVTRRKVIMPAGTEEILSVTECKLCRAGSRGQTANADAVLDEITALNPGDRRRLARWIGRGRRGSTPLERAWNNYRRLPAEARESIQERLDD